MSEWIDTGDTCGVCGYIGPHLSVDDGDLLYCGRCKHELEGGD